ncbi:DUF2231 domain-containing protein [Nakamurella lactea]|uniref:DUF2231 domain-containing protein n=1 Tax=Nakamurella lactea TaxID=459515 RepID=UPI0006875DA3|nr:DUF2231 domain-containing protein [Nakamurella lactea]
MNGQLPRVVPVTAVNGLPAHILLVHGVVVLVPLAALLLVLAALWPAAHRRLGVVTPAVALIALVLVPITTSAGEALLARLPFRETNPLIRAHTELGDELLPWVVGLFVAALLVWGLPLLAERVGPAAVLRARWLHWVVAVLAVAVSVVTVVQVVRIGEAGSRAVYSGVVCADPVQPGGTCSTTLGA